MTSGTKQKHTMKGVSLNFPLPTRAHNVCARALGPAPAEEALGAAPLPRSPWPRRQGCLRAPHRGSVACMRPAGARRVGCRRQTPVSLRRAPGASSPMGGHADPSVGCFVTGTGVAGQGGGSGRAEAPTEHSQGMDRLTVERPPPPTVPHGSCGISAQRKDSLPHRPRKHRVSRVEQARRGNVPKSAALHSVPGVLDVPFLVPLCPARVPVFDIPRARKAHGAARSPRSRDTRESASALATLCQHRPPPPVWFQKVLLCPKGPAHI